MTDYRALRIGDTLPPDPPRRRIFAGQTPPTWWVIRAGRRIDEMDSAAAKLRDAGAGEAWFPAETVKREYFSARKRPPSTVEQRKCIVPGLIFCLAEAWPQWDLLKAELGVTPLMVGIKPVSVTPETLAHMAAVPDTIRALQSAMAAQQAAERALKQPRVGELSRFVSGPFRGITAMVESIHGARIFVRIDGLAARAVEVDVAQVERVAK